MLRRFGPSLAGLAVFAAVALLYVAGDDALYHGLLSWWGIEPYTYPFVDTESVLRALECWRAGVDVLAPNTCMKGGLYNYSPFMLHAAVLPIGVGERVSIGLLLALAFLLSLAALPPATTSGELTGRILAVLSAACVFVLERGNLDGGIFVLTAVGVCLALRRDQFRHLGYAVFVLAALVKFYPAVLLVLAARERLHKALVIGLLAAVGAGLLMPAGGTTRLTPIGSPYGDMFGALNLPYGLFMVQLLPPGETWDGLRAPLPLAAKGLLAALMLMVALIVRRNLRQDGAALSLLGDRHTAFLVAGSIVICACFFAAQNIGYRAVFLVMVLPGLFQLAAARRDRYAGLIAAVMFLLWEELFRRMVVGTLPSIADVVFWWFREAVWWWVIARLASLLGAFVLNSETMADVRRLASRAR